MVGGVSIKCPICTGRPARIYKCTSCGEVRCGQDKCTGSKGGSKGWASAGTQCRFCGEGRYAVLDFFGKEMDEFVRQWRKDKDKIQRAQMQRELGGGHRRR